MANRSDLVQIATIEGAPVYGPPDPEYIAAALAVLRARLFGIDVRTISINRDTSLAYVNGDPAFDPDGRVIDLAPVR